MHSMIIDTWFSRLHLYLAGHPWVVRAIYGWFLLFWVASLGSTTWIYPWGSTRFGVPYALLLAVPCLLLLAHIVWCSFWSWLLLVAVYLVGSVTAAFQFISTAVAYVPVKWDLLTASGNILFVLVLLALPLPVFALTKPPQKYGGTTRKTFDLILLVCLALWAVLFLAIAITDYHDARANPAMYEMVHNKPIEEYVRGDYLMGLEGTIGILLVIVYFVDPKRRPVYAWAIRLVVVVLVLLSAIGLVRWALAGFDH
jgi:hypothetical protein